MTQQRGVGGGAVPSGGLQPAASLAQKNNYYDGKRSQFVAAENIAAYIRSVGEDRALIGYLTCPGAHSLEVFQRKWKSFRDGVLRKLFPSGMWVRERQSKTGDWHTHFVVGAGFDVRSCYPWAEVAKRHYGTVDPRIRAFWKLLREKAELYGFGRHNLEPIRTRGDAAARYLSKYLSKRTGSDKLVGEERSRLFGIWGVGRYCSFRFSWNTVGGSEHRRKLATIARLVGQLRGCSVENLDDLKRELGQNWWRKLRRIILSEKPWPVDVEKTPSWLFDELWIALAMETKWDAPYWLHRSG